MELCKSDAGGAAVVRREGGLAMSVVEIGLVGNLKVSRDAWL